MKVLIVPNFAGSGAAGATNRRHGRATCGKHTYFILILVCVNAPDLQDLERLERQVSEMGEQRAELDAEIAAAATKGDLEELTAATQRLAALTAAIDAKTERWLELAEQAEQ